MTQEQFDKKGMLLTLAEVLECGIKQKALKEMTVVLVSATDVVPFGKIGAVPYGTGRKHLYRKCDIAVMVKLKH